MNSTFLRCEQLEERAIPATFRIVSPGGLGSMTTLEADQTTTLTETLSGEALVDGSAPTSFLSIDDPSGATSDNELEIIRDDRFDLFANDVDEIFMFSLGTFTFSPSATFTARTGADGTVADVNNPTIGDPITIEIVAEPGEELGQPVDVTVGVAGEQFIINTIPGVISESRRIATFDPGDGLRQLLDHTFVYDDPATAEASATQTFRSAIGQTFRLGTRLEGVFEVPQNITSAFNIDGDGAVGFSLQTVTEDDGRDARNERVSAGTGRGGPPEAVLYDANLNTVLRQRIFEAGFFGGIRTATAELSGDGQADLIAAAGPGRAPSVKLINADGSDIAEMLAFEPSFTGGLYVAAADFNNDGFDDIIISPDEGGGPRVRILSGLDRSVLADFFGIDDMAFRGGARAAAADMNNDGTPDLIVGAGFGGGPRLAVFDGTTLLSGNPQKFFSDFFVFEQSLRNGTFVAGGDVSGDGFADLIVGGGPGGGPRVFGLSGQGLLSGNQIQVANFFAGDSNNRSGVRVTVKNLDGDNRADIVVGPGEGSSTLTAYSGASTPMDGLPSVLNSINAFPGFAGGIFVG